MKVITDEFNNNENTVNLINQEINPDASNSEKILDEKNKETSNDEFEFIEIDEIAIGMRESGLKEAETSISVEAPVEKENAIEKIESFSEYIERKTREIKEEQERKEKEIEEEKQEKIMLDLDVALEGVLRRMEEKTPNWEKIDDY